MASAVKTKKTKNTEKPKKVLVGKQVIVMFQMPENPFTTPMSGDLFSGMESQGEFLIVALCRLMNIQDHSRCTYGYDASTKTAMFRFIFERPSWAPKAAQWASLLKGAVVTVTDHLPEA